MKRTTIAVLTAAMTAAISLPLVGIAAAVDPVNSADLQVSPGGIKKAVATWEDWSADPLSVDPFDAYLVTADDDSGKVGLAADRTAFVDDAATREVTFEDLTSGTDYYFQVYAIDYTDTGIVIVEPDGTAANTPIGYTLGAGFGLTINAQAPQ